MFQHFNTCDRSLQDIWYYLLCTDEREHYADLQKEVKRGGKGENRGLKNDAREKAEASYLHLRRCEELFRSLLFWICPPSNKRYCVGTSLPCCTKDILCFSHTLTHWPTHWNTKPLKLFPLSEGTRFWAQAYKYLFADSLLVFWATEKEREEL